MRIVNHAVIRILVFIFLIIASGYGGLVFRIGHLFTALRVILGFIILLTRVVFFASLGFLIAHWTTLVTTGSATEHRKSRNLLVSTIQILIP